MDARNRSVLMNQDVYVFLMVYLSCTDFCSCKDCDNIMIVDEFVDETNMDISDNFDSDNVGFHVKVS